MRGSRAILVPKDTESVDDQRARAAGAAARGLGWSVESVHEPAFADALAAALAGPVVGDGRDDLATNGAWAVAALVQGLLDGPAATAPDDLPPDPPTGGAVRDDALARFLSGWGRAPRAVPRAALDAVDLSDRDLRQLADHLVAGQRGGGVPKPVLLVSAASDTRRLSRRHLVYETVLTAEELAVLVPGADHGDYRRRRRDEVVATWGTGPAEVLVRGAAVPGPAAPPPAAPAPAPDGGTARRRWWRRGGR